MSPDPDPPPPEAETVTLRAVDTVGLEPADVDVIRALLVTAFADDEDDAFSEEDWIHAIGGRHVLLEQDGEIVGHAAVVERDLHLGDRPVRTGYVEAVAIHPRRQGRGLGSLLMELVATHIRATFELGALDTGKHGFYERLGWRRWRGPTSVRTSGGNVRTPDEDGNVLIIETPATPFPIDLTAPISCEWREGDVW